MFGKVMLVLESLVTVRTFIRTKICKGIISGIYRSEYNIQEYINLRKIQEYINLRIISGIYKSEDNFRNI